MMQTWAALVLLLLYFVVFLLSQPYDKRYLNNLGEISFLDLWFYLIFLLFLHLPLANFFLLERGALLINIVTLLFGVGLFVNEQAGESKNEELAVFITFCILILNLLFVGDVTVTLCRHSQYCSRCHLCKKKRFFKKPHRALLMTMVKPRAAPTAIRAPPRVSTLSNAQKVTLEQEINVLKWQKNLRKAMNENLNNNDLSNTSNLTRVEQIEKNHQNHRNMAIQNIKTQQINRRSSVQLRVQARKKVKHANVLVKSIYFSNLDPESISKIIDAMDLLVVDEKNYDICRQGDAADIFYIIVSGKCNVTIDGTLITVLNEFDVFGEQALLNEGDVSTRGATVTSASSTLQLLALPKIKFDHLIVSGTLNEECLKTLKRETEKRIKMNEGKRKPGTLKRTENKNIFTKYSKALKFLPTIETVQTTALEGTAPLGTSREVPKQKGNKMVDKIRMILKRTLKNSSRFHKLISSLQSKKLVDTISKKTFLVFVNIIVNKYAKMNSKKSSFRKLPPKTLDELWISICTSGKEKVGDVLPFVVVEKWLGLQN